MSPGRKRGVGVNSGLAQDGPERTFCHVALVVRERDLAAADLMTPDFVAAWAAAVEPPAKAAQFCTHLAIAEACQAAQLIDSDGNG